MNRDESEKFFTWMDKDENGFVDLLEWNEFINKNRKFSNLFVAPNPKVIKFISFYCQFFKYFILLKIF